MASAWDFIGGFSGSVVDNLKEREKAEALEKRDKMLEGLRRETMKYEFDLREASDAKKVDKDLSYYDPTANQFVQVNKQGETINRVEATAAQKQAHEAGNLELEGRRVNIDNVGFQQRMSEKHYGLQAQQVALQGRSIDSAAADRAERRAERAEGKEESLYGLAQKAVSDIAEQGVSPNVIARVRSDLYGGINTGKYTSASDIRKYQAIWLREASKSDVGGQYGRVHATSKANTMLEEERIKKRIAAGN